MSVTKYASLSEFAARFPKDGARAVHLYGEFALSGAFTRMLHMLEILTPVGGSLGRDRHAGLMKRSWRATTSGGPLRAAVAANTAPHALIIDMGRRRSKLVNKNDAKYRHKSRGRFRIEATSKRRKGKVTRGRMLGSKQAPRGVIRPAWKYLKSVKEQVLREAISRAERAA